MTAFFLSLLGISVSVSLAVVMLMLLAPFLNKRYAAKWNYLIWIFLALRLLIPFHGGNGAFVTDALQIGTPGEEGSDTGEPADITEPHRPITFEIPEQMTDPLFIREHNTGIAAADIVILVWEAGALLFSGVHFISYFSYKRQVKKKGRRIKDADTLDLLTDVKRELHIRRSVELIESSKAGSPMVIGFLKPVVVLPGGNDRREELYFILKHELVHLKRGDVWFGLLFVTANAVHWFNPFIWMMRKEAVVDMELSCDERVTQGAGYAARKAYTETLMKMLDKRRAGGTVLSTQFYGGTAIMKRRFKNILIRNRKKNGIVILITAALVTVGLGMMTGCSVAEKTNGRNLPAADAFALPKMKVQDDSVPETEEEAKRENEENDLRADDTQTVSAAANSFAAAYFAGDTITMESFLADTYEGETEIYESTGTVSKFTVKGLSFDDGENADQGGCIVSVEFRDSSYDDMFLYLTILFVRQEEDWKIQFYGVEG